MIDDRDDAMKAKHRARAVAALAYHRCACDLTDGFCSPRDGVCRAPWAESRPDQNCMRQAESLMQAIETVGCSVVWIYDKALSK